jgi:hypothetical protein
MNKYHIEIEREFDSTWGIMEQEKEPNQKEMEKWVKEEVGIEDDPGYMNLKPTLI